MSRYEVTIYDRNDGIIVTIFDNMDDCSYNTMISKSFITENYNQTIDNFSSILSYCIQNNSYDINKIDDNVELYIKYDNLIKLNYNIVLTKNDKLGDNEDNEDINILNDIKTILPFLVNTILWYNALTKNGNIVDNNQDNENVNNSNDNFHTDGMYSTICIAKNIVISLPNEYISIAFSNNSNVNNFVCENNLLTLSADKIYFPVMKYIKCNKLDISHIRINIDKFFHYIPLTVKIIEASSIAIILNYFEYFTKNKLKHFETLIVKTSGFPTTTALSHENIHEKEIYEKNKIREKLLLTNIKTIIIKDDYKLPDLSYLNNDFDIKIG